MQKLEQGTCPKCGKENLEYGAAVFESTFNCTCVYYPRTCGNCGVRGEEWYNLEFDGHFNVIDKEGNDLPINKEENVGENTVG